MSVAPSAPPAPGPFATHGGRLAAARAAFPDAPGPWLDLSTGINPHGYPVGAVPADAWGRLPDADAEAALLAAARRRYGVPAGAGIVAAPGTQAVITLLPRLLPVRRVAVYGFGYQEHPRAWRAAGAEVVIAEDGDGLAAADVAVVVNPNNPDGRHLAPDVLATLASRMAAQGGTLVVDEAFADALPPESSLLPYLSSAPATTPDGWADLPLRQGKRDRVSGPFGLQRIVASHDGRRHPPSRILVLRSFGKFFGLAGLRLGFAAGDPALCAAIGAALGPWAVSGPALAIGARALADGPWQDATRARLVAGAARLDATLAGAGLVVLGGTPLFRLARRADAPALFERLARAGILVRPFAERPDWLRFGLPPDEAAWGRLAAALGRPGTC